MLVAPQISVLEMLSDEERGETVRRMLGKLKARERRAMELWMEGMSIRAIADELKTTVGAVKMLKYRTILKLKEQVKAMNIKVE